MTLRYPSFKSKVTLCDRTFMLSAPKLWKNLPREIRESSSVIVLSLSLRRFFLKEHFIIHEVLIGYVKQ